MNNIVYRDLSDSCRWNETDAVSEILHKHLLLDITCYDYKLFSFALQNDNPILLLMLVKYVEHNQSSDSFVTLTRKIEELTIGIDISLYMQEILDMLHISING